MAACLGPKFNMDFDSEVWLSNVSVAPGRVTNFVIDLEKKKCQHEIADRASVEFPTTHPYRNGMLGTRYNYLMANDRPGENLPYMDVVKVNVPSFNCFIFILPSMQCSPGSPSTKHVNNLLLRIRKLFSSERKL